MPHTPHHQSFHRAAARCVLPLYGTPPCALPRFPPLLIPPIRNSSFSSQRPLSLYLALFVPARLTFITFTATIVWFLSRNPNQPVPHHSSRTWRRTLTQNLKRTLSSSADPMVAYLQLTISSSMLSLICPTKSLTRSSSLAPRRRLYADPRALVR